MEALPRPPTWAMPFLSTRMFGWDTRRTWIMRNEDMVWMDNSPCPSCRELCQDRAFDSNLQLCPPTVVKKGQTQSEQKTESGSTSFNFPALGLFLRCCLRSRLSMRS